MVLSILFLALVALELSFHIVALRIALPIFESKPPFGSEHYPDDPSAEAIVIPTPSGRRLQGSLFRALQAEPRGLILFCHELDSNRWSALAYCEGLLAAGFNILAFDFRNHGESDAMSGYEPACWVTGFEVEDVLAAVAYIEGRPDLREMPLGAFGVSRGGGAALVAASRCDLIRRVAADGAYSCSEVLCHFTARWAGLYIPGWILRLEPLWHSRFVLWVLRTVSEFRRGCRYANVDQAVARLRDKPVFLMSGQRDTYVIPEMTRKLHALTGQAESALWIVPGAKHNLARQASCDEYDRRLIEFFAGLEPEMRGELRPVREAALADGQSQPFVPRARRSEGMTVG